VALGLAGAWGIAELLKLLIRRPRPFDAIAGAPDTLLAHPASFSFPSGDAALAFGAAAALGIVAPRYRAFALLFALAVAVSRVLAGVHYPSDVLAGAILGSVVGRVVARAETPPAS